ncbi:hypothetical protein DB346_24135 [Verrucomicrobia bacterium LW23]|nr:hypothetical protein DB346_24135 [Verrucomicrobia bacterium LW23]
MQPLPAPLFLTAVAFATGVGVAIAARAGASGPAGAIPWVVAALISFGLWWLRSGRVASAGEGETPSAAYGASVTWGIPHAVALTMPCFLLFVACAGSAHTALLASLQTLDRQNIANLSMDRAMHGSASWTGTIVTRVRSGEVRSGGTRVRTAAFGVYVERADWTGTTTAKPQPMHGLVYVRLVERLDPAAPAGGAAPWARGDVIRLTGPLAEPRRPRNPGEMDEAAWLRNQGIAWIFRGNAEACKPAHLEGRSWLSSTTAWCEAAREETRRRLTLGLEQRPDIADLLSGMVLGTSSLEDPFLSQAFRRTGTYHVFAVSGQNVMMVATVAIALLWLLRFNTYRWSVVCIPLVVAYCAMTGFEASVVRAMVMACVILVAYTYALPVSALNTWAAAMLVFLLGDPNALVDIGFQLSFAVVLAIIVLSPPLYRRIPRPWHDPNVMLIDNLGSPQAWGRAALNGMALMLAASVAAWVGSLPLMMWHFHQISLIALLANVPVVMLAGFIVTTGTIAVCVSLLSLTVAMWLNQVNLLLCTCLIATVQFFAAVPGGSLNVAGLGAPSWFSTQPHVLLMDTGPGTGGSAILYYRGRTWLINPGRNAAWHGVASPALRAWGVNALDVVVSTELTQKQCGAAEALLTAGEFAPGTWIVPPGGTRSPFYAGFLKSCEARGYALDPALLPWLPIKLRNKMSRESFGLWTGRRGQVAAAFAGAPGPAGDVAEKGAGAMRLRSWRRDVFVFDEDFRITVLSPQVIAPEIPGWVPGYRFPVAGQKPVTSPRAENRGLVLLLEYKETRVLWAGRVAPEVQAEILARHPEVRCDVLIQAWNPANAQLQQEWLEAMGVKEVLRPASEGHLFRLEAPGAGRRMVPVRYQDETGALHVRMESQAVVVQDFIRGESRLPAVSPLPPVHLQDYYRELEMEDAEAEQVIQPRELGEAEDEM